MENILTLQDLKHDSYYSIIYQKNLWLLKYNYNTKTTSDLKGTYIRNSSTGNLVINSGWGNLSHCESIKLATPSEIKHLDACILAGKYVEPIKEIEYEIY